MEGMLEIVSAQMHTNTKEVLAVGAKLDQHIEAVQAQTKDYIDNIRPVVDRIRLEQAGEL